MAASSYDNNPSQSRVICFALVFVLAIFANSTASYANTPLSTKNCPKDFEGLGQAAEPPEVTRMSAFRDMLTKFQAGAGRDFWLRNSSEQEDVLNAALKAGEITPEFHQTMKNVIGEVLLAQYPATTQNVTAIISRITDPTILAYLYRGLGAKTPYEPGIRTSYFFSDYTSLMKRRCGVDVTPECETSALQYLVATNRREISDADLALRINQNSNVQFFPDTAISKEESEIIHQYLKDAFAIGKNADGSWYKVVNKVHVAIDLEPLLKLLNGIESRVKEAVPDATIGVTNVMPAGRGEAGTFLTHVDGGEPSLQVLVAVHGENTWVQTADGAFVQMSKPGQAALLKTRETGNGAPHLSPVDESSVRTLLRIWFSSQQLEKK